MNNQLSTLSASTVSNRPVGLTYTSDRSVIGSISLYGFNALNAKFLLGDLFKLLKACLNFGVAIRRCQQISEQCLVGPVLLPQPRLLKFNWFGFRKINVPHVVSLRLSWTLAFKRCDTANWIHKITLSCKDVVLRRRNLPASQKCRRLVPHGQRASAPRYDFLSVNRFFTNVTLNST